VGVVVGEGAESIEFFLTGCVPEGEFNVDIVDEYVVDVVFEDGWFVDGWEIAARKSLDGELGRESVVHYPRVKTFRRDVFPQAPSPLWIVSIHTRFVALRTGG
jgi:hypothetical protein